MGMSHSKMLTKRRKKQTAKKQVAGEARKAKKAANQQAKAGAPGA